MSVDHPHNPLEDNNSDPTPSFPGKNGPGAFGVPDGYFDGLAGKIFSRLGQEEQELQDYPLLNALPKILPYSIPDQYFEQSAPALERQGELAETPLLAAGIPASYAVPDYYFEQSAQGIITAIEYSEETALYPALAAQDKKTPFAVPIDYFEDLSYRVRERLHAAAPTRTWWQSLILTIFAPKTALAYGTLVIAGLFFLFVNTHQPSLDSSILEEECTTLACLDKNDLMSESTMRPLDEESLLDILDVNALSDSLQLNTHSEADLNYVLDNTSTQTLLEDLP